MSNEQIIDEGNWRFEYKYRLPLQQYLQVRNALEPYMELDRYSNEKPDKKYLVRSLYYDSLFLNSFEEKINGDSDRIKLRIRTYTKTETPSPVIKAEIKVRKSAITEKYVSVINLEEYNEFKKTNHWESEPNPTLEEFERYVHLKTLTPQVLIEYEREGYISRAKEEYRLTFDHNVRSAHSTCLFPKNCFFQPHHPGIVVLEIKCTKLQPVWLRNLVHQHGLRIMANSKYVQGIMVSHPALVTPAWSA